jgi:hypothetical protein
MNNLQQLSRSELEDLSLLTMEAQRRNLNLEQIKSQAQAIAREQKRCRNNPAYFIDQHVQIEAIDEATNQGAWVPFRLWPAQRATLATLHRERMVIVLKARQLGLSWLVLGYALWMLCHQAIANVLIFSKRDTEAINLLHIRLSGMYGRLNTVAAKSTAYVDSNHALRLNNGSSALAFPTTGGRSYTASLVVVDEADFVEDLDALIRAVKPTIDAGGKIFLISTADKGKPESAFKRIFKGALERKNDWTPVFLPWHARPGRNMPWYEAQRRDSLSRTGWLDDLYQEYPATSLEALSGKSADKRFPPGWLAQCDGTTLEPIGEPGAIGPALPNLVVWQVPLPGKLYVIGADPAEGNPQSDESALAVLEAETQEQVAELAGRLDPAVFGDQIGQVSAWYNHADAMVERNNHGHAVLLYLRNFTKVRILRGRDGKEGWNETQVSKAVMYDSAAEVFRGGNTTVRSPETIHQLASIEGATLSAPEGQYDDRATAYALALAGLVFGGGGTTGTSTSLPPTDVIAEADRRGFSRAEDNW